MRFLPSDLTNKIISFYNPHRQVFDTVLREMEWQYIMSDFQPLPYDKLTLSLIQHLQRQIDDPYLVYISLLRAYFYPKKRRAEKVFIVPLLGQTLTSDSVYLTKQEFILGTHSARARNTPYELIEEGLIPDTEYLIDLGEMRQAKIYQIEKYEDRFGIDLFETDEEWIYEYENRARQSFP